MEFIDKAPTLQNFDQDMQMRNKAVYRIRDNHVVEVEIHYTNSRLQKKYDTNNQVRITIWTAQKHNGRYVPGDGALDEYHWYITASGYQNVDKYVSEKGEIHEHAEEVASVLADPTMGHFDDFCANYADGGADVGPRTDVPK